MAQPALSAIVLLLSGIAAQQTYVVDAQRAGTQFTSIPAAIAAAQDGDVLIVREGFYPGFVTSKGVRSRTRCWPEATRSPALRGPVIRWQGLTADRSNVLRFSNPVSYVHD